MRELEEWETTKEAGEQYRSQQKATDGGGFEGFQGGRCDLCHKRHELQIHMFSL